MSLYFHCRQVDKIHSEDFYLFAKAGMAHVNGKIKIQDNHDNEAFKQSAWESTFTLGTGFKLSDDLQYS